MAYKNLIYERQGGIAKITINRPEVMNAMNQEVLLEIKAAILEASKDDDVRVMILTGAGRAFSAGLDLKWLTESGLTGEEAGSIAASTLRDLISTMQTVPKVVIAMVNGHCFTGALEMVLGCDLIVASDEAKFGDTHARWGFLAGAGMIYRLPNAVGIYKAKEISFTAQAISAVEAQRIGLINLMVPTEKLEGTVQELAQKIMANSQESVAGYKYLYNQCMADSLQRGLDLESSMKFVTKDADNKGKTS